MAEKTISPKLLEVLRCPEAVHYADSGLKYPIREGIPVMLIEEGKKWKDTAVEDLPVPVPTN
jgi:uncharacterized protein YbaR (Trm112 family)